jgi:hypothetical protein
MIFRCDNMIKKATTLTDYRIITLTNYHIEVIKTFFNSKKKLRYL